MALKLSEEEYQSIRKRILKKLHSNKCWSKGHILYERLKSGFPGHIKGSIDEVLKDLQKAELVLLYSKTKHGDAYQLNIKRLKEIEEIIKQ